MLERFSVRKPMTVLVGLILIVVLGVVSVTDMTMDLMPEMELPFVAVVTTYVGATPEEVERDVSIPLETGMGTISGIETVQSISAEHMSIVILEFNEATNMDAASIEIRESLDMLSLPDGTSRPMMIRMNPEMLPIMTANIYMEGMTIHDLSDFVITEIGPALEAVPGVAIVSLSGLVSNQLHVVIDQSLIDIVNEALSAAMLKMIEAMQAEAEAEMASLAETLIAEQVEDFAASRMTELMGDGLSQEAAQYQLSHELPVITEMIAQEVTEAMMAEMAETAEQMDDAEPPSVALPDEMLTVDAIAGILAAQDFSMPAGMIMEDDSAIMVRVGDTFDSMDEIDELLIFDPAAIGIVGLLEPVRLSDIATIFITDDSHLSFTRVNGNPGVMLSIQRQSGFATADVAADVRDRMDSLLAEHPGLGFAILMDQGAIIGTVINSVLSNLVFGGILAILILLVFLRDIRPTLIVAVSIPASVLLAFTLMYFTGVSMNMMSMAGLALTVGMLVDNSIVVIENIYRMRATTDRSVARAAISGAKQVSGAIFAATITTLAMFLPILFTGGLTLQLFSDFALTLAFSLLASLIIALTVVPAASSVMLKKVKKEQEGRLFTRFIDGYEKALRFSLRVKWVGLVLAACLLVLSFWGISRQGMDLIPPMDMGQITVSAEMPDGTLFEEVTQVAYTLSDRTLALEGVETVGVSVGAGGMMGMMAENMGFGGIMGGGTAITMYVITEEDTNVSSAVINAQIQEIADSLGLYADVGSEDDMMTMMAGDAISLRIEGRELDDIRDTAIAVADLVSTVPGAINITNMQEEATPELRISVNKDAAMAHGLTVAQVFMATMEAINAPESSLHMTLDGTRYEIVVSDGDFTPPVREDIESLQIPTMTDFITLSDIAEVYDDYGFVSISRLDRNRFVSISGEIAEGYNVTLVNNEIEQLLQDFTTIGDTRVIIGGEAEAIAEAFGDLLLMLLLGLVFIYLIMVAQFQSLLSPFIIMFAIPLAFTGGFAALLLVGMPLSIVAMVGLILLAGVSINNGILLISRINQMRWEGMPKKDAIIDAGRKRIRPIIMTAVSTVFAMSIIALGFGDGMEMMQPMAIATIGGLLYGTLMTLFIVPILYDLFHKNKDITKEDLDSPESAIKDKTPATL